MPKVRIREVDKTGIVTSGEIPNIVYVPGPASEAVAPKLFSNARALENECALESCNYDKTSMSLALAHHLLCKGMQVLFEGVVASSESGSGSATTPDIDWTRLADKSLYDIRFLTTGEFFCPSKDMVVCAAKRCDAVALLDTTELEVGDVREALESAVGDTFEDLDTTDDPLSFAAAFVPTVTLKLIGIDNKVEEWEKVPASFGYLCAYAESVKNNPMWYAAAGSFRGIIPNLVSVDKEYNSAEIEMLQARAKDEEVALDDTGDNVGIAINPIAWVREFGHIVWGNRTFRTNAKNEDGTGLLKATSFLNCRLLSTEVAKTCYKAARKYTFEQNNEVLWTNFTSQIIPILERMEYGNGILDYKIVRVPTDKKARLAAKVTLIPIEPVEDFDITIELTDSIAIAE